MAQRLLVVVFIILPLAAGCGEEDSSITAAEQTVAAEPTMTEIDIAFTTRGNGGEYVFDGRIDLPPEGQRNGWGVLLIGGGMGNDLDWTVPGSMARIVGGPVEQMTITGRTHHDAPRISRALVDAGFVTMRWSTIRRDDPLGGAGPGQGTVYSPSETIEHARAALEAFRHAGHTPPDRILLLGHSLGGARAFAIANADDRVAGLILLAPVMLTREGKRDPAGAMRIAGTPWGEDVFARRRVPTLIVIGELDLSRMRHVEPLRRRIEGNQLDHVELTVKPHVGHMLGEQRDGLLGPIDDSVLRDIVNWLGRTIGRG